MENSSEKIYCGDGRMTVRAEYYRYGSSLTAFFRAAERTDAFCVLNGRRIAEISNIREPFDFRMHIFVFDEAELEAAGEVELVYTKHGSRPTVFFTDGVTVVREKIVFDRSAVISREAAFSRADRGLVFESETGRGEADGLSWVTEIYRTGKGAPVRVYTMTADPERVTAICGTPHADPVFRPKVIQRVMEEAEEYEKAGETVLGATNGDFFDMFGDCAPSGLCVSGGITVANPDTRNPFFAILRSGEPYIGFMSGTDPSDIAEAVGGGQVIVKDGEPFEIAPLENFGETPHPRTAYGIDAAGRMIAMVVDGRRPEWSNGASLIELAKLMIAHGAVTALNTDGGGSSTFIVRREEGLEMLNHPADLVRPTEDLIRPLFDSLIFIKKQ